MEIGDVVEASWVDGDKVTGRFVGVERGFVLLVKEDGKVQPCAKNHCKFKIIAGKK